MQPDRVTPHGQPLLEVRNLSTAFFTRRGVVQAVDQVSFALQRGEILGIVGETGSGKSVTALSLIDMVRFPGRVVAGQVWLNGEEWRSKPPRQRQRIRGHGIAMIFQNARASLNPLLRVETLIGRLLSRYQGLDSRQCCDAILRLLQQLGIADSERVLRSYPHELSGGMAQRVAIAMALACAPQVLIADEPTTALDVTTQFETLALIRALSDAHNLGIILITHDLGVVAQTCDRVAVMHAGQLVEIGPVRRIFSDPLHPYTQGLLAAVPRMEQTDSLATIPGMAPDLIHPPDGCRFVHRCGYAEPRCQHRPALVTREDHAVMCVRYERPEHRRGDT